MLSVLNIVIILNWCCYSSTRIKFICTTNLNIIKRPNWSYMHVWLAQRPCGTKNYQSVQHPCIGVSWKSKNTTKLWVSANRMQIVWALAFGAGNTLHAVELQTCSGHMERWTGHWCSGELQSIIHTETMAWLCKWQSFNFISSSQPWQVDVGETRQQE